MYHNLQPIPLVKDGEIDYYELCKTLKHKDLFEYMMVDLDLPDGSDEEISQIYKDSIIDYLDYIIQKVALIAEDRDVIYFASITLVYLCFSVYPGGNNNIARDKFYVSFDELMTLIKNHCAKYQSKLEILFDINEKLCKFMYRLLNYAYFIDLEEELKILEGYDITWVESLLKVFYYKEELYDGLAQIKKYGKLINNNFKSPDKKFLLLYKYLDIVPKSLTKYLWEFSDQLADHEANIGFQSGEILTLDKKNGVLYPETDAHIIPLLLPYNDYIEKYEYNKYVFLSRYKVYANYYNDLIKAIEGKYKLSQHEGKESFEKIIIELAPDIGAKINKFIFNLKNSDEESNLSVPYRARSYFYSAEALFKLIKDIDVDLDLEISFLCINYIKGMETLLTDTIQYILDQEHKNYEDLNNRSISLEKNTCGQLLYLITYNRELLTSNPSDWGCINSYRGRDLLDGFVKDFNINWVNKIRNGKMHKSPVLRNYPINNAPEGVRIVTYDYMIQILKMLNINL